MELVSAEQYKARIFAGYAETGDIGQIKDMIREYPEIRIDIRVKDGNTALILASKNGHTDVVKLLFQKGAVPETQNKDGETAVMLASNNGHTEIVKILVEPHIWMGASVHVQDKNGNTPLILASKNGHTDIVKLLLEKGAPPGWPHLDMQQNKDGETALMLASYDGHTDIVKLLLEKGASLDIQNKDGDTALMIAPDSDQTEIVKILIEKGASLDIQNKNGNTALLKALQLGPYDIVKILIEKGASLDIQNKDGETALMIVSSDEDDTETVRLLLEKGANLDIQNVYGETALIIASKKGYTETVRLLVEKGANLDIKDKVGDTALVMASFNGHTEIVILLIDKGARVDIQDKKGNTSLIFASWKGHTEIVRLLLEKGASLDIQTDLGTTALIIASWKGHTEIVRLLVEKGANVNIQNNKGKTAIYYANNETIKEILRDSQTEKWKGFTKSDIEKFDIIFEKEANDYSVCPVCLRYTTRAAGCLYMTHNCRSSGGHYHKKLYNKYKNDEGIICWCTCCSRICRGHRHYELVSYKSEKPELLKAGDPFEKDCRTTNEGGGLPEKLARFRRLREYALELQEDVDKKDKDEVLDELVEEVWNAPLARTKKVGKIAETKKWNISSDEFPKNVVAVENKTNAPNVPFHGKLPTEVESGRNNVMMNDNIPILRFHHKQKNGSEESHGISKKTLKGFVTDKNKNYGDESFGFCFMYPGACGSRLHPKELKGHIPEDLYEDYRKKFNKKFKDQRGGNQENVFQEATDAVCAIVKKHHGGSRKRRATRRNRTRRL